MSDAPDKSGALAAEEVAFGAGVREETKKPLKGGLLGGMKLSFAMDKSKLKPKKKVVNTQIKDEKQEKQFVTTLNASKLKKLTAGKKKKAVVIPLIKKNTWVPGNEDAESNDTQDTKSEGDKSKKPLTLEQEAAEALKREALGLDKEEEEKDPEAIPLLVQNVVPGLDGVKGDENAKFKHDVNMRPEATSQEAYDRVSIEDFGKAALLGMGWQPGKAIGGSNKAFVEPIEFIPRGGRMGLGATMAKPSDRKKKKYLRPGEKEETQIMRVAPGEDGKVRHFRKLSERLIPVHSMQLGEGKLVEFISGRHRKLFGRVIKLGPMPDDETKQQCSIKLNINSTEITCVRGDFQLLDEHALPKDHPAFSNKTIEPEYLTDHARRMGGVGAFEGTLNKDNKSRKRGRDKDRDRDRDRNGDKDRNRDRDRDRNRDRDSERSGKKSKKNKEEKSSKKRDDKITWLRPGLVVRVVSQRLHGGELYNKKGRIEDVTSLTSFTLIMDTGKLVEDAKQRHVQTALPKVGGKAMVLAGEYKGQTGKIMERRAKKAQAVLQLDADLDIVTLSYDDVCEYR